MNWRNCITIEEIRKYVNKNQNAVAAAWFAMLNYSGLGKIYSLADFAAEAQLVSGKSAIK